MARLPWFRSSVAAAALLLAATCHRPADTTPQIRLVSPNDPKAPAFIEVIGIAPADRKALDGGAMAPDAWHRVLRVSVKDDGLAANGIAVAGQYTVADGALRFAPLFPFDPGRQYDVQFNPGAIRGTSVAGAAVTTTVALPPRAAAPPTYVTQVFPSSGIIPENQLRIYIHFSAPMGRQGALEHVKLLDEQGREVEAPFLPLEAEFWNGDRTRYTVFFDPGRQKRGILPNRRMGPSLVEGRTYTLVVEQAWTDGNGKPLRERFTRRFRAGPPHLSPLDYTKWNVAPPAPGTRAPLTVTFPQPLDHALMLRAIGVRRDGEVVTGEMRVDGDERRWTMIPSAAWSPGRYELIALSILEDRAGNGIGRAFEVVSFARGEDTPQPAVTAIPFALAPSR